MNLIPQFCGSFLSRNKRKAIFARTTVIFMLYLCDECVVAGQNVYLGPTIHLPRPEGYFESHHSRSVHEMFCFFRTRSRKWQ